MPFWINPETGAPEYVDEFGNPTEPTAASPNVDTLVDRPAEHAGAPALDTPVDRPVEAARLDPLAVVQPGMSYGQSGFDPARHAAVRGTQGRLDAMERRVAGETAEAERAAGLGARSVYEGQRDAALGVADVESQRQTALADEYRQQARLHSMFAAAETAASDVARERTTQYRARYEQAAANAAAMEVDPRLQVDKGQMLGLAAALFAQGFLTAGGVAAPNVTGMVSQMIERNVDLQLEKIRRGEKLAEDQRRLWDMARVEADDEATARDRLKGLMLAQSAAAMEAETAKYGSRLATAKGQAAAADLRAEFQKTLADITNKHFDRYMKRTGQELDRWKAEVAASQGWARINLDRDKLDLEAGKGVSKGVKDVVFDTTESGGGRPIARFKPGVSEKTKEDVQLRAAGNAEFAQQLREYRELALDAGKMYGGWGKASLNPDFRQRVETLRQGLGAAYVKAMSGAAATDAERQALISRIPLNRILQKDGEGFLRLATADMQKQVIRTVGREIQAFTTPLSAEEAAGLPSGTPLGTFGAGEAAEGRVLGELDVSPVEDRYSNAIKRILSPDAGALEPNKRTSNAWVDFADANLRAGTQERAVGEDAGFAYPDMIKARQPEYAQEMEYLVKEANSPDTDDARRAQSAISGLLSNPEAGYRNNFLEYLLENNPIRRVLVSDDPDTPVDESDLLRGAAGTGVLDFPEYESAAR